MLFLSSKVGKGVGVDQTITGLFAMYTILEEKLKRDLTPQLGSENTEKLLIRLLADDRDLAKIIKLKFSDNDEE